MADIRGLCAKYDPELWFPLPKDEASTAAAKAVCARCEARLGCLTVALDRNYEFGIWGGMTEEERRAIRRRGGQADVLRLVGTLV